MKLPFLNTALAVFPLFLSVQAFAVPTAKCSNDAKTVTANFYYYQNLRSDSVEVGGVRLSLNGKSYSSNDASADDRTRAEMKLGFVLFEDGTTLVVSDLARYATVYDVDGATVAKLDCGR